MEPSPPTVPPAGPAQASALTNGESGEVLPTPLLHLPSAAPATTSSLCSEHVSKLEADSEELSAIQRILDKSNLDDKFECRWKPACFHQVHNKTLQSEFDEKKQDLLIRGRKTSELEEFYGFLVDNNTATVDLICNIGMQARDSEYNALGYNRMGVYLCKHADVCLQHALVKYSGSPCIRLVVCKYLLGRHTKAIPRVASASEFIEPTQGFDAHMSVIPPSTTDSLQNQFDRSQVFLFEINKLLQPSVRPRQLLPIAVVSFTQNGEYHPSVDAEATSAEKLATNPRLQHIIKAINSKDDRASPNPGEGSASSSPAPVSPATCVTPSQLAVPQDMGNVIQQINAKLDSSQQPEALLRPPDNASSPFRLLSPAVAPSAVPLAQAPIGLMPPQSLSCYPMKPATATSLMGSPFPMATRTLPISRSLTPELSPAAAYLHSGLLSAGTLMPSSLVGHSALMPSAPPMMYPAAVDASSLLMKQPLLMAQQQPPQQTPTPVLNPLKRPLQASDLLPDKRVKYF